MSWNLTVRGAQLEGRWAEWYRRVVREGLAGADLLVAPSRWMLQSFERCYGELPNSRVIYNGRTPELFSGNPEKQNYAASAGRLWDDGKHSSLLMELGSPPLPILVAGAMALEGEPASARPEQFVELRREALAAAEPSVQCAGELSEIEMRELLAQASIYIATSKYEPFGLAPLEAALSRCAIVANDIPSLREVWEDAALYFRKDDARSLGEVLGRLRSDWELCRGYANRAYHRAVRLYSAERMVDEYLQAYLAALLRPRAKAA
jgi:glycosyltransferase involved in cell wall biosynthesis